MATNRNLKAYVRFDGSGRVVPSSLILQRFKPKVGNWLEIPANECCNYTTTAAPLAFRLLFDSVESADLIVGDSSNVNDWNTFMDLPALGTPFTSVSVVGSEVFLYGGANIDIKPGLMYPFLIEFENTTLISINDEAGCIISVGGDSFSYCSGLLSVNLPACTTLYGYEYSPYIDEGAFGFCTNLLYINLPLLTANIGTDVLRNCTSLSTLNFPNLINGGDYSFYFCTSVTSINMPELTVAGSTCFGYNYSVLSINLPKLTTVGVGCFGTCLSVTSITLPLITSLPNSIFLSCSNLVSLNIPTTFTTVGSSAFYGCSSLTNINFLPLATSIGNQCFTYCTSLTNIEFPSCTNLGNSVLDNQVFQFITGKTITLKVPTALMTCNAGNPDGDIQTLQANNTVTVITV